MSSIQYLPSPTSPDVLPRLKALCDKAIAIRSAIAFWTLDAKYLGDSFIKALRSPSSFLCVDIHYPTVLDELVALRSAGARIYLHLYDLAGQTELPGAKGVPPHLMHSKSLVFDLEGGKAMIWIGSHNATQRALHGLNIESSVLIETEQTSSLYGEVTAALESIRDRCDPVDPGLIGYYKWLQSEEDVKPIVELEQNSSLPEVPGAIRIFGTVPKEYTNFKKVGNKLFVSISSIQTGVEHFFEARVSQSGEMTKGNSQANGVRFEPCSFAFRDGTRLPLLLPLRPVTDDVYLHATYFVQIQLVSRLPEGTYALESPVKWEEISDRLLPAAIAGRVFGNKKGEKRPRIRRAASPEYYSEVPLSLADRRAITNHSLVRRRILRIPGRAE